MEVAKVYLEIEKFEFSNIKWIVLYLYSVLYMLIVVAFETGIRILEVSKLMGIANRTGMNVTE